VEKRPQKPTKIVDLNVRFQRPKIRATKTKPEKREKPQQSHEKRPKTAPRTPPNNAPGSSAQKKATE